jgi:parallel beta-helix repeat protein
MIFSIESHFTNASQINILQLQALINISIPKNPKVRLVGNDEVHIIFENELTLGENTELLTILETYTYLEIYSSISPNYEATVSDIGDYQSIAAAFNDGRKSVKVQGSRTETENILIPSYGQLDGESPGGTIINFDGNYSIIVDGSSGIKENIGTISLTHGTTLVNGVDTMFTNLTNGDFILVGTNYYQISSIISDTQLQLVLSYVGKTMTNVEYIAQSMYSAPTISNVTIANSTGPGVFCRAVRHGNFKSLAIVNCNSGFECVDCGDMSLKDILPLYNVTDGMVVDNSVSVAIDTTSCFNNGGNGFTIKNKCKDIVTTSCASENNAGAGVDISNNCDFVDTNNFIVKNNNSNGMIFDTSSTCINVSGCEIVHNNGYGILNEGSTYVKFVDNIIDLNEQGGLKMASNNIASSNIIKQNKGNAVEIPSANLKCVVNGNQIIANQGHGITTFNNKNIITNNNICDNTGDGIRFDGSYNNVSSNSICDNNGNGILVTQTTTYNLICNNIVTENKQKGILIETNASNNLISNNISHNNIENNILNQQTNGIEINNISI